MSSRIALGGILFSFVLATPARAQSSEPPIAKVNGQALTAGELAFSILSQQFATEPTEQQRQELMQQLIDRELIRQFLDSRQINVADEQIDRQIEFMRGLLQERNATVEDLLSRLHLSEPNLRRYLSLLIAWRQYVQSVTTEQQIADEWNANREHYDGTRVKASQIVRIVSTDAPEADWEAAKKLLADVRAEIEANSLTFAEAAGKYSQSPSAAQGGDLGTLEYRGRVHQSLSDAAFELQVGEISQPFQTPFGVHLVQVRERLAGELSLEDARPEILQVLGDRLWQARVAEARKTARIEILAP